MSTKSESSPLIPPIWRWALACLWLALLPLSSRASEPPLPTSNLQLPTSSLQPLTSNLQLPATARAFTSPTGHAAIWLTPGPAPELWLAAENEPPRRLLIGESEHFSAPVWSPDGRQVAVQVVPTGTATATLGRWQVVDIARRMVEDESIPIWLAVVIPPTTAGVQPPASSFQLPASSFQLPTSNLQPPSSIRVAHHPANSCRDLPDWEVTVVPFEEYVARVLPAEVYTSWAAAALQAQAIAVRTFAWRKVIIARPDAIYDITDWAVDQVMCDSRYPSTDAATAATAGRYLAYRGEIILAQYSAENGHPTVDGGLPYLKPVLDPVGLGRPRYGHGHGLSQWGAQRWASQRGWNAVQILVHYYTGVQVIDPVGGNPLLNLLSPWPGTWLTGSTAYLTAHASFPPTATVTMTFTAPNFRSLADIGSLPGLWTAEWPLPATLTRPVTITVSAALVTARPEQSILSGACWFSQAESKDAALRQEHSASFDSIRQPTPDSAQDAPLTFTHTLTLSGEDRLPPALRQITVPTSSSSLTITLRISATDAGASGLAAVAAGGDWQTQATDFTRRSGAGALAADPGAFSGHALALPIGVASRWEAALPRPLETSQVYQAYARLQISDVPAASEVQDLTQHATRNTSARIELYDPASNVLLGFADLRPGDFRQENTYQEFPIDFWLSPQASGQLEIRLITLDSPTSNFQLPTSSFQPPISFDRLRILRAPQPFAAAVPYRLEHRAGLQPVVVKALDAAGNPSVEISGTTQLVDTTPPGGWSLLAPAGWVTTTLRPTVRAAVADGLTGIDPASAAVRFTTDAGVSWSAWLPVSATARLDGTGELSWVWPGGEGSGANRVQFRVSDNVGLSATGPAWPVRVDVTPPVTTLAVPPVVRPGRTFSVAWLGWDAGAGVATFDVQVSISHVPGTSEVPGTSSEVWQDWLLAATVTQADYLAPTSGAVSFRVRARDLAGNLSPWSAPQTATAATAVQFLPLALSQLE